MSNFHEINCMFEAEYAQLDRKEQCGTDTTCLRLMLGQKHVKALTDHMNELVQVLELLDCEKNKLEQSLEEMCARIECMEKELSDADDIIRKLKCEIEDVCQEAKAMDEELKKITQCLEESEYERSILEMKIGKQLQTIDAYKEEIKTLSCVNDNCQKELTNMNLEMRRMVQKMTETCSSNKELQKKINDLEHCVDIYKDTLKNEEGVVTMKDTVIEELKDNLDQAQARIIDWQVKALAGDDAVTELDCLNTKIMALVPELEEVCQSNEQLKAHGECLKSCLDAAQQEIVCLREKVYAVACECAELDACLVACLERETGCRVVHAD